MTDAAATAISLSALCLCSTFAFLPKGLSARLMVASVGANWSTTTLSHAGRFSNSPSIAVPWAQASMRFMFLIFAYRRLYAAGPSLTTQNPPSPSSARSFAPVCKTALSVICLQSLTPSFCISAESSSSVYAQQTTSGPKKSPLPDSSLPAWAETSPGSSTVSYPTVADMSTLGSSTKSTKSSALDPCTHSLRRPCFSFSYSVALKWSPSMEYSEYGTSRLR